MIKSPYFWKKEPITRPNNYFNELAGVKVHYDRLPPPYNYGSRGKPIKFYATKEFQEKLARCFAELWDICPFGNAEVIASAGAYTNKAGWHGKGLAFDLDGIFWGSRTFIADKFLDDPKLYLGIQAILLKHFGTVLNYHYDEEHRDHFHIQDDGHEVGFRNVTSVLMFLQPTLMELFDENVYIDGDYNQETEAALMRTLERLNIERNIEDKKIWLMFLTEIAKKAFNTS